MSLDCAQVCVIVSCHVLEPQEGVKMSLDCAQACFLTSDKLVISLKGGEL